MSEERSGQDRQKYTLPASSLAEDILSGIGAGREKSLEAEKGGDRDPAGGSGKGQPGGPMLQLVTFTLGKEEYALRIAGVREVMRVAEWTRVPGTPDYIKGVINLRGRIIPVVDPKVRMKLDEAGLTKDSRVMVTEHGGSLFGLLVDGVQQVMRLPSSSVEEVPREFAESKEGFITGMCKVGERLILLLDLVRVCERDAVAAAAIQ